MSLIIGVCDCEHWQVCDKCRPPKEVKNIFHPWIPPFRFEETSVFDSKGHKVFDMRGWGFLTGHGAGGMGFTEEKATKLQDSIGKFIADLMNKEATK